MRLLFDTHAFLWFVLGDTQLSSIALAHILDPQNTKLVSPASYWEIAIKISLGKYVLTEPYDDFMRRGIDGNGFSVLHIHYRHTSALTNLKSHHRDPFDRLLIVQAKVEGIPILSNDPIFDAYSVSRIW